MPATLLLFPLHCLTGMAPKHGGHISFVGREAAGDSAATPRSSELEKQVEHEIDSVYDEEEVIATKESDFKHKQVYAFARAGIYFDHIG